MKVGVRLSRNDFMYDMHSLVKAFFPDDDVSIYTEDETEKCSLPKDLEFFVTIPEYEHRKETKDGLKRSLYRTLCDYTGHELPWGTLSGIRPTKIPMKMLEEGMADEQIIDSMMETYLVSRTKAELSLEVAKNEMRLLRGVPTGEDSMSLYLHVPFCPSICLYCTFSASPVSMWQDRMDEYLDAVEKELYTNIHCKELPETVLLPDRGAKKHVREPRRQYYPPEKKYPAPVTFYVGGGTPTSLTAAQLDRLLTAAENTYDLANCRERTVEAGRPDSITREKLEVLRAHGINRISVNPQTMNQRTLDLIGRHHTVEDTKRAFALAREVGFDNINMDIILGLPGEEPVDVEHTLREIEKLDPDSLTIHSLAVKRASRLTKALKEAHRAGEIEDMSRYAGLEFVNSETIINMAYAYAERMGMSPYYLYRQKNMKGGLENTGFAKPGKECLYNILIMEEKQEIRAFGAGASSKTISPDGLIERIINPKDVKTYLARMEAE
jgi:oxygen-independent coproporphyrinogen-3 oxidase